MKQPIHLSYVICTTVRSGSWMLCSALTETGIAGKPAEYFGQTLWEEITFSRALGKITDVRDFMSNLLEGCTTPNGVFGTKLPANHTGTFLRRASEAAGRPLTSLKEGFELHFPNLHYLLLKREDKLAQAVSLYRAAMTGQWRLAAGGEPTTRPIEYDYYGIARCYQHILASNAYWEGFFTTHNISPLTLTYEELVNEYESSMRRILASLGLPWHRTPPPRTARQADERSREWAERFKTEGLPAPEPPVTPAGIFAAPY